MLGLTEEPVVFDVEGARLIGILHHTATLGARWGVLIVVGGPQYRVGSHRQFVQMARALAAAGYPVFRFDYRGMGDADGPPRSFADAGDDIRRAIDEFCRVVPQLKKLVLWGLCDAASAILMMRPIPTAVVGLIAVNPWVRTDASEAQTVIRHYYLKRVFQRGFWDKLLRGSLNVVEVARGLVSVLRRAVAPSSVDSGSDPRSFIDRMVSGCEAFTGQVLFVLSGKDLVAREFDALQHSSAAWKNFLHSRSVRIQRLENADHTFSSSASMLQLISATVESIRRAQAEDGAPSTEVRAESPDS